MSLDPMPDTDTLLRMKAEREARGRRPFTVEREPLGESEAFTVRGCRLVPVPGMLMAGPHSYEMRPARWPISLRIPWSALVSDNAKYGVVNGKLIAQKPYRAAKKAIGKLAADAMNGRPAAACPLALVARVYVPDNRVHDVVNFSKCVHDALKGTVFTDDQWLHDVRWIRAGVDVDAPRAEITISPLLLP